MNKETIRTLWIKLSIIMLCGTYIWFRFIRERLPKSIPFILSLIGLLILVFIILGFLFRLVALVKKKHGTIFLQDYITRVYAKFRPNLKVLYNYDNLAKKILKINLTPVIFVEYFFKYCICTIFIYDIFILHCLYYFYKVAILYLFLLIFKSLIEISNIYIQDQCEKLKQNIYITLRGFLPITLEDFIKEKQCEKEPLHYNLWLQDTFIEKKHVELCIKPNTKINVKYFKKQFEEELNTLIIVTKHLYKINSFPTTLSYKVLNIILSSIYFVGWSYILFVSAHTINLQDLLYIVLKFKPCFQDPFK